jgi:formiminotetrahydrofolate cyclodeaminase
MSGAPSGNCTTGFLDALASAAPTPGGGGAAALMGAAGAALLSMVARLTIGKKGHEAAGPRLEALLDRTEPLRARLAAMVDEDAAAFSQLMAAYRLPRGAQAEAAARRRAIQAGLQAAARAPLACAHAAAEGVRLADEAAALGHRNVISDVGVGALAFIAALRSAALNVEINLPQLDDRAFADAAHAELATLLEECLPLGERVLERVRGTLA